MSSDDERPPIFLPAENNKVLIYTVVIETKESNKGRGIDRAENRFKMDCSPKPHAMQFKVEIS